LSRYRHQLNHTPKQIYSCDFPDCNRTFVRLDLCNRHKDRHTAKGSSLNRKDLLQQQSPMADRAPTFGPAGSASPEVNRQDTSFGKGRAGSHVPYQSPKDGSTSFTPIAHTSPSTFSAGVVQTTGIDGYVHASDATGYGGVAGHNPHHSPVPSRTTIQSNIGAYGASSPVSAQPGYHSQDTNVPLPVSFVPQQSFPPMNLPPSNFSSDPSNTSREASQQYAQATTSTRYNDHDHGQPPSDMMMLDQMSMPTTLPVFGSESIMNKSPFVPLPEDFLTFLFQQEGGGSPLATMVGPGTAYPGYVLSVLYRLAFFFLSFSFPLPLPRFRGAETILRRAHVTTSAERFPSTKSVFFY
jgi:hypothetical protein